MISKCGEFNKTIIPFALIGYEIGYCFDDNKQKTTKITLTTKSLNIGHENSELRIQNESKANGNTVLKKREQRKLTN